MVLNNQNMKILFFFEIIKCVKSFEYIFYPWLKLLRQWPIKGILQRVYSSICALPPPILHPSDTANPFLYIIIIIKWATTVPHHTSSSRRDILMHTW